jgi:hypothetical protein
MIIGYELLEQNGKKKKNFKLQQGTPFAANASFRSTYERI